MRQRSANSAGNRLLMILTGLFLYAPIIILIVFSFNAGTSSSVWKGFSLHWYAQLFQNRLIMHSVYLTLLVSLLATVIATIAGTFAAIGFYGMRRKARNGLLAVNNIPMMNADIVTGVSLCLLFVVFFNCWGAFAGWVNSWQSLIVLPERLTMGFGTLLIAHICFNIPYVILSVGPKLRQMDRNLVDAAQDLGCTWMQAFWKVIIPEIKPGIISGALTAFTMSIDDFIISYFSAGTSASTLAMIIYGVTKKGVSPEINAISTLLFVAFFNGWGHFSAWFNTLGIFQLPTHLSMGFGTLLIAHITFNIPYVILSVSPKLRQMDRNLVDAAMDLGCTWMQAFWKVIIPEIKPGIVSGALTAFTMSIDDFVISYFTAGSGSSTLAMTIYGMTKKKVTPEINAISTLLFVTVLVLLAVINLREARQERKQAAELRKA